MGGDTVSTPAVSGARLGAFLDPAGKPQVLDGPAVGGTPVTPLPIGLLEDTWTELPLPMPTVLEQSPFGSGDDAATLDSLHFGLEDLGAGPKIAGHATRHARLHVVSFSVNVDPEGRKTPFRGVGTADLWFAPDLPFSWLPVAGRPGPMPQAVPLGFWLPWASTHVARALAPRLAGMGLLVRAEVLDSLVVDEPPGAPGGLGGTPPVVRTIWVDSLAPATDVPSADAYSGMQHISELRLRLAAGVAMIAGPPCRRMTGGDGGSFRLEVSGPSQASESGRAFSLPPDTGATTGPAHLVLEADAAAGKAARCLLIDLPAGAVRTGTFRLSGSAGPDPSAARALEIVLDPATHQPGRIAVLDDGELVIRTADAGSVAGRLTGTGWSLEVDTKRTPPRAQVLDGLSYRLEFDAVPTDPRSDP